MPCLNINVNIVNIIQVLILCCIDFFHIFYTILKKSFLAGNNMFKVNNRNTRARCEMCSKLTIKTLERSHWRRSGVFTVNFEHISHLALVFPLLTLSRKMPVGFY